MAAEEPLTPFGNALAGALGGEWGSRDKGRGEYLWSDLEEMARAVVCSDLYNHLYCTPPAVVSRWALFLYGFSLSIFSVKTRIQADSAPAPTVAKKVGRDEKSGPKSVTVRKGAGMLEGMITIAKSKEGIMGLYRGFGASMVNTFSTQFAYFYWYTVVRTLYVKRLTAKGNTVGAVQLSTAIELLLGALAGGLAQMFTIPVSVIATRQQLAGGSSSEVASSAANSRSASSSATAGKAALNSAKKVADLDDPDSFLGVARDIMKKDGITGFWRGLKPSLVLTINPAITYGVYERVKNIIMAASVDGKMTPWKSFLVGAISKTLATVVTFPYILSKIRLQAKDSKYTGAFDVLSRIAKEKGITGWYQGMQAQITKAVIAQALLFYFRDYFEIWTRQLLKKK